MWHLDGYDKLKPYGFAIHDFIDWYVHTLLALMILKRAYHMQVFPKIIWLELLSTNNNLNVVLVLYLLAVLQNNGMQKVF